MDWGPAIATTDGGCEYDSEFGGPFGKISALQYGYHIHTYTEATVYWVSP